MQLRRLAWWPGTQQLLHEGQWRWLLLFMSLLLSPEPRGTSSSFSKNTHCAGLTPELLTRAGPHEAIENRRPREGRRPGQRAHSGVDAGFLVASVLVQGHLSKPCKRNKVVTLCEPGRIQSSFDTLTWEQAGHHRSRPSLLPERMTLNHAPWARLLMCWVLVTFLRTSSKTRH